VGLSVSVRMGELENVERNRDKSLGVSVYLGQRRGNASTSDFSPAALKQTVQAAYDIARFTAEDPAAGLPDADDLATPDEAARDLDLFHPWAIDAAAGRRAGARCEAAALAPASASPTAKARRARRSSRTSGPATRAASAAVMPVRATTCRCRRSPAAAAACSATPGTARCATPPTWPSPEAVGRYAAERALSRLKSRRVPTGEVPVLFEAPWPPGLLGALVQATSGGALYRKASFLLDSLGQPVLARTWTCAKTRTCPRARAARPSTTRACAPKARRWSRPAWCRATSCPATRRASWA
jgi:PmbA protein